MLPVIRKARESEFEALYKLGLTMPELSTAPGLVFMEPYEFKWALTNPNGVFLVAEIDGRIVGFIYLTVDRPGNVGENRWANLVYIGVVSEVRGAGVASRLFESGKEVVKGLGATYMSSWARDEEGNRVIAFFEKNGMRKGHSYRWMDIKL